MKNSRHLPLAACHSFGFTLIELLVVIAIVGILAGLAVPALKDLGKSNVSLSASRQLLDDIGHARQLALSQRTTVYMVFVPTNFWEISPGNFNSAWFNSLTPAAQAAATNLCDKQMTGYTFISLGTVGDQPGRHNWHYLAPWQNLPDGTFIAQQKFSELPGQFYTINKPASGAVYNIYGFSVTNNIPFPTETNIVSTTPGLPSLPYIAFNSFGRLVSEVDSSGNYRDAYIPLAKGSVSPAVDGTKRLILAPAPQGSPQVLETPPGNSTNISYNIVHIDALTGRAILEFYKMQ